MQCFLRIIFFLVLLLAFSACTNADSDNAELSEDDIYAFALAFHTGDFDTVSKHIAEGYIHVNSGAAPYSRTQWLAWYEGYAQEITNGDQVFKQYEIEALEIQRHQDAAYVSGVVRASGERFGDPFSQKIRFTNLWVWEDDRWKRAGFHDVASSQ